MSTIYAMHHVNIDLKLFFHASSSIKVAKLCPYFACQLCLGPQKAHFPLRALNKRSSVEILVADSHGLFRSRRI